MKHLLRKSLSRSYSKNKQETAEAVARNEAAIPVDKVEKALKEEPVIAERSNQVASTTLESLMQKMDEQSPTEVTGDNAVIEEKEKELVPKTIAVEAPPKEEVENVKREIKNMKIVC
ncbi:hypothetical protein BC332_07888 [Capsicum chinense]|nr:hypothetical protein BC332_07888 [Capsicum chinense]